MSTARLKHQRQRFLKEFSKEVLITETLYHGTPIDGLDMILNCDGEFHPPDHGELPLNLFSVSLNDNMLEAFSEGDGVTGFVFNVYDMPCLEIDQFHHALLCLHESSEDPWRDLKGEWPGYEHLARKLRYETFNRGQEGIDRSIWADIRAPHIEGVCLPGYRGYDNCGRQEQEIAVNRRGCKRLWESIDYIVIQGHEMSVDEAKYELRKGTYKDRFDKYNDFDPIGGPIEIQMELAL